MATNSPADCGCRPNAGNAASKSQQLGLDELMIVNPSAVGSDGLFEGGDGNLYRVQGTGEQELQALGQLFLGDDGTVYRAEPIHRNKSSGPTENLGESMASDDAPGLEGYLLAADGNLYEIAK